MYLYTCLCDREKKKKKKKEGSESVTRDEVLVFDALATRSLQSICK